MARHSQTFLPKVRTEAQVTDGNHIPQGRDRPILLRLWTSSGCKIKVLLGPGLQGAPRSRARPPCHSPSTALWGGHSLSLVPGDWLHLRVGQQVWAVAYLHVYHVLLGLHLHKLIGNPFDGLPAAPGKGRERLESTPLGCSRSDQAVPNPWQTKPTWGPQSLIPRSQDLGLYCKRSQKSSTSCQLYFPIQCQSSPPPARFNHPTSLSVSTFVPVQQLLQSFKNGNQGTPLWDFPGPVVKNLPCSSGNTGSIPGQETKIPQAAKQVSSRAATRETLHRS